MRTEGTRESGPIYWKLYSSMWEIDNHACRHIISESESVICCNAENLAVWKEEGDKKPGNLSNPFSDVLAQLCKQIPLFLAHCFKDKSLNGGNNFPSK